MIHMGTPAFPNLGKHCSLQDCKLLDFLPYTCHSCQQVFCHNHRSYIDHRCPKSNKNNVTVALCPHCAKGVHLLPDEDPNITWESHVNTECDPSHYENVTNKKQCPVLCCKETLTISNTIKCSECDVEHCLIHRFGPIHNCPGPKKPDQPVSIWPSSLGTLASLFLGLSEGLTGEGSDQRENKGNMGNSSSMKVEKCPFCSMRFGSAVAMVEHVQRSHKNDKHRTRVMKVTIDVCPKCGHGFRDPIALMKHIDKDHI